MKYFPAEAETGEGNGREYGPTQCWGKRCKGNENQTINVYFNASLVAYNGFKSVLVYTAFSYRECNIYSMM